MRWMVDKSLLDIIATAMECVVSTFMSAECHLFAKAQGDALACVAKANLFLLHWL